MCNLAYSRKVSFGQVGRIHAYKQRCSEFIGAFGRGEYPGADRFAELYFELDQKLPNSGGKVCSTGMDVYPANMNVDPTNRDNHPGRRERS